MQILFSRLATLAGVSMLLITSSTYAIVTVGPNPQIYTVDSLGAGVDVQKPKANETPSVMSKISNFGMSEALKGNVGSPQMNKKLHKQKKSKK